MTRGGPEEWKGQGGLWEEGLRNPVQDGVMGRRDVPQRELPALLAELEEQGATEVRRAPAGPDGMVEVQWEDSPLERQQLQAMMRGWKQILVISVMAVVVGIIVAVIAFLTVF